MPRTLPPGEGGAGSGGGEAPWWFDPVEQKFYWTRQNTHLHSGVDVKMPPGTPLISPVEGDVEFAGQKPWGGQIDILVPPGELPAPYDPQAQHVVTLLHGSREDVQTGQHVLAGTQLGLSGTAPPGYFHGSPDAAQHTHVEVTHGGQAPYRDYSPWHPSSSNYPVSSQPLLDYVGANGLLGAPAPGGSGGTAQQSDGGAGGWNWNDFLKGLLGGIPIVGAFVAGAGGPGQLGAHLSGLFAWIADPLRVVKLVVGISLLLLAVFVTFLPAAAAVAVTAAGAPEAAPAVSYALGGTKRKGAQGVANRAQRRYTRYSRRQKQKAAGQKPMQRTP